MNITPKCAKSLIYTDHNWSWYIHECLDCGATVQEVNGKHILTPMEREDRDWNNHLVDLMRRSMRRA